MNNSYYLIRHGQTDWNLAGRWQGNADIPLNATGKSQAAAIAARLATRPIKAIYSSPLSRAAETAAAIAQLHQLPIQFEPDLRERNAGIFEGLTRDDIERDYPASFEQMKHGIMIPPEGETSESIQARAVPIVKRIIADHPADSVVIVSHGGTIGAIIAHLLNLPLKDSHRYSIYANCALTRVENTQRGLRLMQLNDTGHLEQLLNG
ncbi:MAG: histidine phosphatase family protein [Candidatus Promineifilaceae bacterium]